MIPFIYPDTPHQRRHSPAGYNDYESYRPWLRDEFIFRCVYCLKREQWGIVRAQFNLDHFVPQTCDPQGILDYDNLLYACQTCNSVKRDFVVPDPCKCMLANNVIVHEDGRLEGTTTDARRLIRLLGLDDAEYREFRRLWIDIVAVMQKANPGLFRRLMKYPDSLPDLSILRPPSNSRPESIDQSHRARRARGELPDTY